MNDTSQDRGLPAEDAQVAGLVRLRRLRRGVYKVLLVMFLLVLVPALFVRILGMSESLYNIIALPPLFVCALILMYLANAIGLFACPRCGKRFFRKGVYHNSFRRSCMHCGLRAMKTWGSNEAKPVDGDR